MGTIISKGHQFFCRADSAVKSKRNAVELSTTFSIVVIEKLKLGGSIQAMEFRFFGKIKHLSVQEISLKFV